MGRLKEIHDAGINRSAERWCPHHAAHRGSLNVPALPAGSRVERNALTPRAGTRSAVEDWHPKLVEITDNLAAHAGEARSLLDELVAAGARERDLGKADDRIEETITGYREDFHRWGDAERQRRRWLPGLALAVAAPAFLLLGVLVEQQFLIVPLNDPSRGWSGHIWDNYGPRLLIARWKLSGKTRW